MNILSYVERYGNKTFSERPFSDVDAIILSQLSYLNFDLIAPSIDEPNRKPRKIKDIPAEMYKKLCDGEFTTNKNIKLLVALKSSQRFRELAVKLVQKEHSRKIEKQFFGITIELPDKRHYMAFRGTDLILFSWKEDLSMAFLKKVPAQETAVEYVKKVAKLIKGEYFIGGHSKGGNLAFYAALNQTPGLAKRCLRAYSFDGQGYNEDTKFDKRACKIMENKLVKIVPENCIVGIMLHSMTEHRVVKANSIGVLQHDPYKWKIDPKTGDFSYSRRTKQSFIDEKSVADWLDSLSYDEKVFIVNVIFECLGDLDISVMTILKRPVKTINNLIKVHYNYSKDEKAKIRSITNRLIYYYKKAFKYYSSKEGMAKIKEIKEKTSCLNLDTIPNS